MKIDIYNHVMTPGYLDLLRENSKDQGIVKRMTGIRVLWDMEARVDMLKQWPDLQQVLTLAVPPPEVLFGPDKSPDAARLANDEMYEICRKWPDKFPVFVASMPMNNPDAAIAEMDRAITKLGARGIQICTNVAGRPLDEPEFFPVFERVTKHHDLPIFMHPVRPISFADYKTEDKSKFEVWQVLGWP